VKGKGREREGQGREGNGKGRGRTPTAFWTNRTLDLIETFQDYEWTV